MAFSKEELEHPGEDLFFLKERIVDRIKSNGYVKTANPQEEADKIILAYPPYVRMMTQAELHQSLEIEAYRQYRKRIEGNGSGDDKDDWYKGFRLICDEIFNYSHFRRAMRVAA